MAARVLAAAALVSTIAVIQVPAHADTTLGKPLYAVTETAGGERQLTRLDPATLSSFGSRAALAGSSQPAAFSPDESLLAFVQWQTTPSIRILELPKMHWHAEVPVTLTTGTVLVRWLTSSRLLVLAEQPDGLRALLVDARTDRVVRTTRISGHLTDRQVVDVGRTHAAVLLRSRQRLGPVRVAVVSFSGSARTVTLKLIREGASRGEIDRPSLVADPSSDRAYVVGALGEPVATIDLRTLAVSYRRPFRSAGAIGLTGAERVTVWLGRHRFAVAGWDDGAPGNDSKLLGLRIVDTGSWRAQALDPASDYLCVAGHSVVAHHVDGVLNVFGFDGRRRLTLTVPDGSPPGPTVSNDRYLYLPSGDETLVADLNAGVVIGRRPVEGLQELLSPAYTLGAGCR
jgi:hypothetical protein